MHCPHWTGDRCTTDADINICIHISVRAFCSCWSLSQRKVTLICWRSTNTSWKGWRGPIASSLKWAGTPHLSRCANAVGLLAVCFLSSAAKHRFARPGNFYLDNRYRDEDLFRTCLRCVVWTTCRCSHCRPQNDLKISARRRVLEEWTFQAARWGWDWEQASQTVWWIHYLAVERTLATSESLKPPSFLRISAIQDD